MKRIILASQSPRRKELLQAMNIKFEVIPSEYEEELDDTRSPSDVAKELALGKALDVAKQYPDAYVIGADTIVTIDGKQLEKPLSPEHAHEMLQKLSGKPNFVTTGIALVCVSKDVHLTDSDTTAVFFKPYDEQSILAYIATGDSMDKAGAYGIQSGADVLIDHFEGEYDTIVGLPSKQLRALLERCKLL